MKKLYICSQCSYKTPKWLGKCLECGAWESFEELEESTKKRGRGSNSERKEASSFSEVKSTKDGRLMTTIGEFDRVLGGGLVVGSVVLISGKPGIGKSTLLLQVLDKYSKDFKVLYVAGEESASQVKGRGDRVSIKGDNFFILPEVNISFIGEYIKREKPKVVVIDSIQTLFSPDLGTIPGTVSQIREASLEIVKLAKENDISFLVVGHITKDGKIAGPKLLEHMVDAVLEFEGEEEAVYRMLRATKNRYGSVNEIGIFNMGESGIREVVNPSEYFLEGRGEAPGSVVVPILEGNRVLLIEVQSLVSNALFGVPRRLSQGIDSTKIQILSAVIEKQSKVNLTEKDIFFNIPGGVSSKDTSLGLGIVFALISSLKGVPIPKDVAVMGEVGLTGEVRKVPFALKRAMELQKIGFKKIYAPEGNRKELSKAKIKIHYLEDISNLIQRIT